MPRTHYVGKPRNITEALLKEIKPHHHVLAVGPDIVPCDATPIIAASALRKERGGQLTVMDSQWRSRDFARTSRGSHGAGGLDSFMSNMRSLEERGYIKVRPEFRAGDYRDLLGPYGDGPLPEESLDVVLEQNMIRHHEPWEQTAIADGCHAVLRRGGKVLVVHSDYSGNYPKAEDIAKVFRERGFRVRMKPDLSRAYDLRRIPNFAEARSDTIDSFTNQDRLLARDKATLIVATKPKK